MGPEVISRISTAVPIILKLVRGSAGSFDDRTSDLVLRASVEAVHPNSNGRSRYRYRRYRNGSQKSGAKCKNSINNSIGKKNSINNSIKLEE